MFRNLLHITLLTYIWKRYKALIVSTLLLFFYIWLLGKLHEDFISYANLNNDTAYLGLSFVLKWLGFLLGFLVYFLFNLRFTGDADCKSLSAEQRSVSGDDPDQPENDDADPFGEIRQRQKLRSKADFVIEKKNS